MYKLLQFLVEINTRGSKTPTTFIPDLQDQSFHKESLIVAQFHDSNFVMSSEQF